MISLLRSLVILAVLIASPVWAQPLVIPLTVQEPTVTARVAAPITSGVPLPPGTALTGWALFDGATELPLQVTPLKGRVPWLLLDFQTDLTAGQVKTLTLKQQTPMAAGPVLAPSQPATALAVTLAGDTTTPPRTLTGVQTATAWEYQGPLRSVLRVDGRYGDVPGFGYTTRYTFYKGKPVIRIEHILRNSLRENNRPLKLTSATLTLGAGATAARSGGLGTTTVVPSASVTFELLPVQQAGMRNPSSAAGRPPVNVADNNGYLLPDLTHYGTTLIVDPANAPAATWASPPFARADSAWYAEHGELSTRQFGSLEDERVMNRRLGWAWSPNQEPTYPSQPFYGVNGFDVATHYDPEGDDTNQNTIMFLRTGKVGYLDRMRGWANYQKWEMSARTDGFEYSYDGNAERTRKLARPQLPFAGTSQWDPYYINALNDTKSDTHLWGGDHSWGWGLVDYYMLTGDVAALEGAIDVGEMIETLWLWRTSYYPLYGTRGIGRNLSVAVRLYDGTNDIRWKTLADKMVGLMVNQDSWWRESWGTWSADSQNGGHTLGPHHVAEWYTGLYRYHERIGNAEVKRRLIKISTFAKTYALHPKWQQSAKTIIMDRTAPGSVGYDEWTDAVEPGMNPYHTMVWVDILVRGYRLTGDTSFLQRAFYHWDRASKAQYGKLANYRTVSDTQVGAWANGRLGCCGTTPLYYADHGNLPFIQLMFWDAARVDPALVQVPSSTPPLPSQFTVTIEKIGGGAGTVTGAGNYASGATASLSAVPLATSKFDGWGVCSTATTPAITLTVTANVTCAASFTLLPLPARIDRFDATPPAIVQGGSTVLTWETANAASVTLNGAVVEPLGTQAVSPPTTTTYDLVADGVSQRVTVTVTVPPTTGTATLRVKPGLAIVTTPPLSGQVEDIVVDLTYGSSGKVVVALPPTYQLSIVVVGQGAATGTGMYPAGAPITLGADPAVGFMFTGWSPVPCADRFAMPGAALTCTATFTAIPPPPAGTVTWAKLSLPVHSVDQPLLTGNQGIPQGQPGAAVTICPRPIQSDKLIFRSFSGPTALEGWVANFGGGHAGHPGNDIDFVNLKTGVLVHPNAAECPPPYNPDGTPNTTYRGLKGGGAGIGGVTPLGRSWASHTYYARTMRRSPTDGTLQYLYVGGQGTWSVTVPGGVWTLLAQGNSTVNPTCGSACGIVWEPTRDVLLVFMSDSQIGGPDRGIYEYSFATKTYRRAGSWPSIAGWGWSAKQLSTHLAPDRGEVLILASVTGGTPPAIPNRLFRYTLATGAVVWDESLVAGTPQFDELMGDDGRWARNCAYRTKNNTLYCYTNAWGTVKAGFWKQAADRTWSKLLSSNVGLSWYSLDWDNLTDRFLGFVATSTYCGVSGAACGGLGDLYTVTVP